MGGGWCQHRVGHMHALLLMLLLMLLHPKRAQNVCWQPLTVFCDCLRRCCAVVSTRWALIAHMPP